MNTLLVVLVVLSQIGIWGTIGYLFYDLDKTAEKEWNEKQLMKGKVRKRTNYIKVGSP